MPMSIERTAFGVTSDGQAVERYTLRSGPMELEVITYGGAIRALRVPDRTGRLTDVVLGYDTVAGYERNGGHMGALVGRYANRIAGASCVIDGRRTALEPSEGKKQLHGGVRGFSRRVLNVQPAGDSALAVTYTADDGEGGWPGVLELTAIYTLLDDGVELRYQAVCDKPTYCNITNHSYFNLNGGGDILGHSLWLAASAFTPVDGDSIPTAMARPAAGTPFDFTRAKPIGRDIGADDEQLKNTGGYDHNFVLDPAQGLRLAAVLTGERLAMECWTEKPGIQVYAGNFLNTDASGKGGVAYRPRQGVCLETQFFPDSPNHPEWGDITLRPGRRYDYTTQFRFRAL